MISILFFTICFVSCAVGAICGIGGGVIIKPVLDAFGILSIEETNFLSGCTVLAMSGYSVAASLIKRESEIEFKTSTPLAVGGAIGGMFGRQLFTVVKTLFVDSGTSGAVQSVLLLALTFCAILYTLNKSKIQTKSISNALGCLSAGFILGLISSFLNIGGGPFNLIVLYYFFSMQTKSAAQNSLYIILFSQTGSLVQALIGATAPSVNFTYCTLMVMGGIAGGILGRKLNKKLDEVIVTKMLICVMTLILFICTYNTYIFLSLE